ncbi:uncharacterized protein LOC143033173 [Oratosquilla oratoria]|uniref:uncharacterized protein LOC143033173 n=1 Tax=Oratosquilla oratoria TaxID=337810 RepID=UPI003F767281
MGWPLGVLFAQAYVSPVEETTFLSSELEPKIYCRYIDDIFVCTHYRKLLERLRLSLQEISGLNFTVGMNTNGQLSFLDVPVESTSNKFITSVYCKPTLTNE